YADDPGFWMGHCKPLADDLIEVIIQLAGYHESGHATASSD
ncbi:hypothetical protein PSYAR_27059, partial [Pseudomonas syringae pv. aceris str. M302273]